MSSADRRAIFVELARCVGFGFTDADPGEVRDVADTTAVAGDIAGLRAAAEN